MHTVPTKNRGFLARKASTVLNWTFSCFHLDFLVFNVCQWQFKQQFGLDCRNVVSHLYQNRLQSRSNCRRREGSFSFDAEISTSLDTADYSRLDCGAKTTPRQQTQGGAKVPQPQRFDSLKFESSDTAHAICNLCQHCFHDLAAPCNGYPSLPILPHQPSLARPVAKDRLQIQG